MSISTAIIHREKPEFITINEAGLDFLAEYWGLADYSEECSLLDNLYEYPPPDLIICLPYNWNYPGYYYYKKISDAWGDIPYLLNISEEDAPFHLGESAILADFSLSYRKNSPTNIYHLSNFLSPYVSTILFSRQEISTAVKFSGIDFNTMSEFYDMREYYLSIPKRRFCNFIYANETQLFYRGTFLRNKICREIFKYKKVDCAGGVMNNNRELGVLDELFSNSNITQERFQKVLRDMRMPRVHCPHLKYMNTKLTFMSQYKFSICGDNLINKGYISEKILDAFICGSIPIYSGCKDITKFFNPKSFINYDDYPNLEALVERIKQIDESPDLYYEYINQPIFNENSLILEYSREKFFTRTLRVKQSIYEHKHKMSLTKRRKLIRYIEEPYILKFIRRYRKFPLRMISIRTYLLLIYLYLRFIKGSMLYNGLYYLLKKRA